LRCWGKVKSIIEWDGSSLQELKMLMFKEMRQNFTEVIYSVTQGIKI